MDLRKDFIGKQVRVVEAKNADLRGITGEVIDETRNTLVLETGKGRKTLLKEQVTIALGSTVIRGGQIVGRPEERGKRA